MRKKLIVIPLINIIFILMCFVSITFAWFAMNDTVQSSGLTISVNKQNLFFNYTVYHYNIDSKEYLATDDFDLRPYDMIIKNRNEHISIIIKLEVFGEAIDKHKDIDIHFLCSDQNSDTMSLSNVLEFKVGLFDILSTDIETIYTSSETAFTEINALMFKTNSKIVDLSYTLTNYTNHIIDDKLFVYVQINYNDDLAEEFNTITADDLTTGTTTDLIFDADIYELKLEAEE